MASADGYIKSTAGGRLVATFLIDGDIMFNFSGGFASSVPAFTCNTAVLNYPSLRTIRSTINLSFEGRVGPAKVTLNLENGPQIEGLLDMPLSLESTVSGSGVWANVY